MIDNKKIKKLLLCTNSKMRLNVAETVDYVEKLKAFVDVNVDDELNIEIFYIPDLLAFYSISNILRDSKIKLSSPDCFYEDSGPYTGEVSPKVLKGLGCKYVLVGHPERIVYARENREMINKKVKAVLRNGMMPVLLVVEKKKDRILKRTIKKMMDDLLPYVDGIDEKELENIILIYEPAWAIDTVNAASPEHVYNIIESLRNELSDNFNPDAARNQYIMYGGGVTPESAMALLGVKNINGIGMGKAGLNLEFFTRAIGMAIEHQRNKLLGEKNF